MGRASAQERTGAARQHPGHHRSAHPGARRRLHPAPHGGHRRPGAGRPDRGRNRSAGTGRAGSPGQGQPAAGAGGAGPGAGQLRAGQIRHGTGPRHGAALGRPGRQGVVSRQENDQYQAQYQSRSSRACRRSKRRSPCSAATSPPPKRTWRASKECRATCVVKAPFDGVITLRNVDVGALVNAGSTLLFRIAQTGTLRTYVNVPQAHASSIQAGQPARLSVSNLPGRAVHGHRRAHRECARSRQPYAAGGSSGAQSGRRAASRHVRPGRPEQRRGPTRRC